MSEEYKNEENFSDNPEENLRIENEILKLKMQAERGAQFGGNMEDLPPELEASFLKNVQDFENSFDKAKEITIYESIGKPNYIKADDLKPNEVEKEITRLIELLHNKNIILEVLGKYDLAVIYKFITEELFIEKIKDVDLPGYIHNYVYEEFHPNHNVSIGAAAQEFLKHWFEKSFDAHSFELSTELITADGKRFYREQVIEKLWNCLNSYKNFSNIKFSGSDTSFEWDDKEQKGMGHAEGMFKYDTEIESGEILHIEGPFKLYMINENGYWQIFYFVFPGFAW